MSLLYEVKMNLNELGSTELKKIAKELKIFKYGNLSKIDLIEKINEAKSNEISVKSHIKSKIIIKTLIVKNSFWCNELDKAIFKGHYLSLNEKEFLILKDREECK